MKCVSNKKELRRMSTYPIGQLFLLRDGQRARLSQNRVRDDIVFVELEAGGHTPVFDTDDSSNGRHNRELGGDVPLDVIGVL